MKQEPQKTEEIEESEMTDFERELAQAILYALEYRGFYDCGKYIDADLIARIRPLMQKQEQEAFDVDGTARDILKGARYVTGNQYPEDSYEYAAYKAGFESALGMVYRELTGTPKTQGKLQTIYSQGITEGERRGAERERKELDNWLVENQETVPVLTVNSRSQYDLKQMVSIHKSRKYLTTPRD